MAEANARVQIDKAFRNGMALGAALATTAGILILVLIGMGIL